MNRAQTSPLRSSFHLAGFLLALGVLAVPTHATGPIIQRGDEIDPVVARSFDLPANARVERMVEAADGAWLTATEPTPSGERLRIARSTDGGTLETLPVPATKAGGVIVAPTPLAGSAGVEALLWFEGTDLRSTALRAAAWSGEGWGEPRTVSPVGPGTQTALAAVVLADGSWLAVWAGFDGVDDEIAWSRFDGTDWSAPRAITANTVPDLTPTLRAVEGGAIVAWSGYDGRDYRVHSARFVVNPGGGAWSKPRQLAGRGAIEPRFADTASPILTYRQVVPEQWSIVELDAVDAEPRRATALEASRVRPRVVATTETGPRVDGTLLAWEATDPAR